MAWEYDKTNFDRNLAVVIGIDRYKSESIQNLRTPVSDARALADLLETEYGYEPENVVRLFDDAATLTGLQTLLDDTLPNQLKPTKGDRLIFYFAGHGIPRNGQDGPEGYLVPQDADSQKQDSFLPMSKVYEALSKLECHHLLVILDCCFAGTFRWAGRREMILILETVRREHYDRFIRYPAWQVMTSAAHDQEALDVAKLAQDKRGAVADEKQELHSPFALALLEGLRENKADLIQDGVITAHELYLYLEQQVSQLSGERQRPGIYSMRLEYDRGEFVFTRPGFTSEQLKPAPLLNESNNPYRGLASFDEKHANFFFGRKILIEELQRRLSQPNRSLTVVLGASGSGKSSLVKAGLIPDLRQESKWYILAPMRPDRYPFIALARAILPIEKPELIEQLSQVSFLDEVFKPKDESGQDDGDEPTDAAFVKLAESWNSAKPEAKLLLVEDYFKQLLALCRHPQEKEQLSQLYRVIFEKLESLSNRLQNEPQHLTRVIRKWSETHPDAKLLLTIDQFEELITMSQESQTGTHGGDRQEGDSPNETVGERAAEPQPWLPFLQVLRGAIVECQKLLHIVLTLRSDFEPRFLSSPLSAYWKDARFPVRAMNLDELRQAIEGPALKQALYFEPPELVGKLIDEVGQMPGALPLLSFTLSELYAKLYERWKPGSTDRALRIKDYEELGGVAGALTRRATQEYDRLMEDKDPEDEYRGGFGKQEGKAYQATMKRVMLRMVAIEGGGVARRRVPESELVYPDPEENKRVAQVSDRLVKARLLVKGQETGKSYVEPAHDFLVRGWDKLQGWIKEEQGNLTLQQRLTPAASDWHKNERDTEYLWIRDPRLALLEKVLESDINNWLNKLEVEFVETSKQKRIDELEETKRQLRISEERRLAAELELGSVIASRQFETERGLESLLLAMQMGRELQDWKNNYNPPLTSYPTVSPLFTLQTLLDSIHEQNRLQVPKGDALWELLEEEKITQVDTISGESRIFPSPDGKHFVTVDEDDTFRLWRIPRELITQLSQAEHHIHEVLFSPNGQIVATKGSSPEGQSTVIFWDISGNLIRRFSAREGANFIKQIVFSPDSQRIAVLEQLDGGEGTQFIQFIQVRQLGEYLELLQIGQGGGQRYFGKMSFTKDGHYLVTGVPDGDGADIHLVRFWNLYPRLQLKVAENDQQEIVSSEQQYLFVEWADGKAKLHKDFSEFKDIAELEGNQIWFSQAVLSPDGQCIVTVGDDDTVRIWSLSGKQLTDAKKYQSRITQITFSVDGQHIAILGDEGITIIQALLSQKETGKIIGTMNSLSRVSFSPDRQRIATVGLERIVRLWDLRGRQLAQLSLTDPQVSLIIGRRWDIGDGTDPSVGFTPDGKYVVVYRSEEGSGNPTLLWKVEGLDELLNRGCRWLTAYLNNPDVSESDKNLCDRTEATEFSDSPCDRP
ncbi:MAG TPA: caspase family protein [Stenomitos sp.]